MSNKAEVVATAAKYGGSATAVYFGVFTVQELAAIVGATVAVLGFLLSWYYKHQHFKLAKEMAAKAAAFGAPE